MLHQRTTCKGFVVVISVNYIDDRRYQFFFPICLKLLKIGPRKWGMFARQHSTLLLQIDTTNALKSYHRSIKRRCYLTDGFVATLKELHEIFQGKISMHAKISNQLFTKRLAECEEYPRLAELAHPFQVLIAREIREGKNLVSEDVDPILESDQDVTAFFFANTFYLAAVCSSLIN